MGDKTLDRVTADILKPLESKIGLWWYIAISIAIGAAGYGLYAIYITITQGLGTWGINNALGWGWDIINFVWWVGIGHAGTAFSIFLLILRQKWRTSINRAAEAMTVFAVICAALFPALHVGRIWLMFYIFPYPNTRGPLWVNFNSPLFWDVVAVSSYLLISVSFWYLGMLPDLATIRDRSKGKIKQTIYRILAMGWSGTTGHWKRYEALSFVLGGIAAVLVVSVHSIVSTDFATSVIPGWHTTLFPPYFVVGAIFSGFAMVLTLMIIIRWVFKMNDYVTDSHLEAIAKILVFISLIMGTAYLTEIFIAWYSGSEYEMFTFFKNRITGEYAFMFWTMFICNAIVPQIFWFKKFRTSIVVLFLVSLLINLGMWYERFNIIVTSLSRDYLPSSWAPYHATWVDKGIFIGTLGIFATGVLIFFRFLPIIAISEVKSILKFNKKQPVEHHDH
jgi:molybdopterin-containing oxidoreductase family membrane subunit